MTEQELWREYVASRGIDGGDYEAWAFGTDADLLARLVILGEKTATSSAYPLYEFEKEPLPEVGEYSVILDARGEAVCVICTTEVTVIPFEEITAEHARCEGEGDKSLRYWREVHETFFTECMREAGLAFSSDMPVVCEKFEVVYRPKGK